MQQLAFLIPVLLADAGGLDAAELNPRLMVSGGASFILDKNVEDLTGQPATLILKDKLQAGILGGIDLSRSLALETGLRFGSSDFRIQGRDQPSGTPIHFTIQQFFCNVVYSTPTSGGGLHLFATGGAGARRIHVATGSGSGYGWSINLGGGLEARPSRRYAIRVELRDFIGKTPRFAPSQLRGGLLHDIHPSIGLVIHMH